jgi:hypothetical protein
MCAGILNLKGGEMQQRIVEFRKKNFWTSQIDTGAMNQQLAELNQQGWQARSVTANRSFAGVTLSYTVLLERPGD